MAQINNEKSVFEKLDHKKRDKSELVFYKLLSKRKAKSDPFRVVRYETFPQIENKPGVDSNDTN